MTQENKASTNAPEVIYLQDGGPGAVPLPADGYDEQVTWSPDSIYDEDTKYLRFDLHETAIAALQAENERLRVELSTLTEQVKRLDREAKSLEDLLEAEREARRKVERKCLLLMKQVVVAESARDGNNALINRLRVERDEAASKLSTTLEQLKERYVKVCDDMAIGMRSDPEWMRCAKTIAAQIRALSASPETDPNA